jgi:hypothetical protein
MTADPGVPELSETISTHAALRILEHSFTSMGVTIDPLGNSREEVAFRRLWTYILTGK